MMIPIVELPPVYTHPEMKEDVWRTWFIDDCESVHLFGVNKKYLKRVEHYRIGTVIYLEDAPLFSKGGHERHRICGPYLVGPSPNVDAKVVRPDPNTGEPVIYQERHPDLAGPWFDLRGFHRNICEQEVIFDKQASTFNYFPFRFRITKTGTDFRDVVQPHTERCPYCGLA